MRNPFSGLLGASRGGGIAPVYGPLERRLLDALWLRDAATSVNDLRRDFPAAAYTTLMTTLDRLYRKGVLLREKAGRAYAYRPRFSREDLYARLAEEAMGVFLDREPGAIRPALSFLVDAVGSRDERLLDELEALVRDWRDRDGGEP